MRKFVIQIALVFGLLGNCLATETFYEWLTEPDSLGTSGGINFYTMISGEVSPAATSDLILQYRYATDANPTPDTSGLGNDGFQTADIIHNIATNGLSAYATWTGSSETTSTVTQVKGYYSWWANTNNVWRFYESFNGTNYTDLLADSWSATDFYNVSGDVITWGGIAGDYDMLEVRTNSNPIYAERSATNRSQAVTLGILDSYIKENFDDDCVLDVEGTASQNDGSQSNRTVTPTSITLSGTKNTGWFTLNGSSSLISLGTNAFSSSELASGSISVWAKPTDVSAQRTIVDFEGALTIYHGAGSAWVANLYDGSSNSLSFGSPADDVWVHIVSTWDGTNHYVYLDGNLATNGASGSPSLDALSRHCGLGRDWNGGTFWQGDIAKGIVLDTYLTSANVANLFTNQWVAFGQIDSIWTNSWWSDVALLQTYDVSTSQDYSGNGNTSTDTAITYDNSSASFDGSTAKIDASSIVGSLTSSDEGSWSAWVKIDDADPASQKVLMSITEGGVQGELWELFYKDNAGSAKADLQCYFARWDTATTFLNFTCSAVLEAGVWHHIYILGGTGGNKVYIDSVLQTPTYATGSSSTTTWWDEIADSDTVRIGNFYWDVESSYVEGDMDNVMFLTTNLNATQNTNLFYDQWANVGQLEGIWTNLWWDNVVAEYTFNKSSSQDYSLNGNSGTDTDVTYDGKTASFNGTSSKITFGTVNDWKNTNFTICGWVNPSSIDDTIDGLYVYTDTATGSDEGFIVALDSTDDKMDFYVWDGAWGSISSDASIPTSQWTHFACTFDGTTLRMYINGVLQADTEASGAIVYGTNMYPLIGHYGAYFSNVSLDDMILTDNVLTQPQIQTLYNDYKPWDN